MVMHTYILRKSLSCFQRAYEREASSIGLGIEPSRKPILILNHQDIENVCMLFGICE